MSFFFFFRENQTIKSYYTTLKNTLKDHYFWQTKCNSDRQNQIIRELMLSNLLLGFNFTFNLRHRTLSYIKRNMVSTEK